MKYIILYPGSFCPPTYGHLRIVEQAIDIFGKLIIVCSRNPEKTDNWFDEHECKKIWNTYRLPSGVEVMAFDEVMALSLPQEKIVMIRGIRDEVDLEAEKNVLLYNFKKFGIANYFYVCAREKSSQISSTKVRDLASGLRIEELSAYVSPLAASRLLEKVLDIRRIYMVVGKPGAGKSTFLEMLSKADPSNVHIDTDIFSDRLKPLVERIFPGKDLIQLALTREDELKKAIGPAWIDLLRAELQHVPQGSDVFVEIPYGMQEDKNMWRFVGGRIIYLGCDTENTNTERNLSRNTPEYLPFIKGIPGLVATQKIAEANKLDLICINTDCSLIGLEYKAKKFNESLRR